MSALDCRSPEHFALMIDDLFEHLLRHIKDFFGTLRTSHQQVKSCLAAHRSKIYNILSHLGIADVSCKHMLQRVHTCIVHIIASIRLSRTQIISDHIAVLAGNIESRNQHIMINCKTLNSIHVFLLYSITCICFSNSSRYFANTLSASSTGFGVLISTPAAASRSIGSFAHPPDKNSFT